MQEEKQHKDTTVAYVDKKKWNTRKHGEINARPIKKVAGQGPRKRRR